MSNQYNWVDNPTESLVSVYNPDILNECLMHLKYDNVPSKTTLCCFNSGNVDEYGKADLIDVVLSTNLEFSQPGVYTIEIKESGNYDVVLIGGGAGGAWGFDGNTISSSSSGGSGAAFVGNIYIPAGTYVCTVGSGGSAGGNGYYGGGGGTTSIGNLISASGGSQGAFATWGIIYSSYGGQISINTTVNSSIINLNGLDGTVAYNGFSAGGQSLYNGFGSGGDASVMTSNAGKAGFLSLKMLGASYINYKIGGNYDILKGTLPSGEQFEVSGLNSDDALYLENGIYNKFIGADGSSELLRNTIYKQSMPPNPNINDVWYNTSAEPCSLLKWNGEDWIPYNKLPIGSFTIENSTITDCKTYSYNQNGNTVNMKSPVGFLSSKSITLTLGASGMNFIAPENGYLYLAKTSTIENQYISISNQYANTKYSSSAGQTLTVCMQMKKGDISTIEYNADGMESDFKFIYSEGCL